MLCLHDLPQIPELLALLLVRLQTNLSSNIDQASHYCLHDYHILMTPNFLLIVLRPLNMRHLLSTLRDISLMLLELKF